MKRLVKQRQELHPSNHWAHCRPTIHDTFFGTPIASSLDRSRVRLPCQNPRGLNDGASHATSE